MFQIIFSLSTWHSAGFQVKKRMPLCIIYLFIYLFAVLFTVYVLIKVVTFYCDMTIWPYESHSVHDHMKAIQWFMAKHCLIKSHLATVSTEASKRFKYWQYCEHAAFLSVLKILCMSLILNQSLIMFPLCWLQMFSWEDFGMLHICATCGNQSSSCCFHSIPPQNHGARKGWGLETQEN